VGHLEALGVAEPLLQAGVETQALAYFNRHGQQIWEEPRGRFAGFAAPQISLGRGALQRVLLAQVQRELGDDAVAVGHRLTSFQSQGDRALGVFEGPDGAPVTLEADLLVCADGIHSAARRQRYPQEGPPKYSGRLLWRATTFAPPFLGEATMIMAGHEAQKFVCYPIEPPRGDGLQRINWIAELRRPWTGDREDWNKPVDRARFAGEFASWQFPWLNVPALIAQAEEVLEFPMVDRDPLPSWTEGAVTLLGDAAHPMYPIGSNGASQAILDAAALGAALAEAPSVAAALAEYESLRRPATAAIVQANRQNGPEQCMQLAEERAPEGFEALGDIFAPGELQAIADRYKVLTGMKKDPKA
jgi:2-polyprenyl-6-methoxyphenol hydroxylase-like FAD-dependent oxidoreductase